MRSWQEVSYRKLRLLDKKLEFTIDLSNVGCGCNAAAYLVEMGDTSSSVMSSDYCDIQGFDSPDIRPCVELDLIEGNRKAVQATLHTQQGRGQNGRCNQDGCKGPPFGRDNSERVYGPSGSARINSDLPFRVTASFPSTRDGAWLDVGLSQGGSSSSTDRVMLLEGSQSMNLRAGRPPLALSDDDAITAQQPKGFPGLRVGFLQVFIDC